MHFDDGHAEFYEQTIQEFINVTLPTLGLPMDRVIAICNAVPDDEARNMVCQSFHRFYVAYPGMESRYCFDGKTVVTAKVDTEEFEWAL